MARRIAAVVFAVAAIAVGIVIRNTEERGPRRSVPDKVDPYEIFDDDQVSILCAPELAVLCERLSQMVTKTRVEPTWTTVDRLADGGALGADAWLTFRPLDEMAAARPGATSLGPASPVGRSPIVMAGPPAAVATVRAACPDARVLLSCAGGVAAIQLMLRDPATSAVGALALAVLAEELKVAGPEQPADAGTASLVAVLDRSRSTPIPYQDVARLQGNALALTLEADVGAWVNDLPYEQQRDFDQAAILYPFEARGVEVVVVPARSFTRANDLVRVLGSSSLLLALEGNGFEVPTRPPYLFPKRVYAGRPTIRYDLPPPPPARLRQLRALSRSGDRAAP